MILEGDALYEAVSAVYERHADKRLVSPSWLATEGMKKIAFPRRLHEIGYVGCHLHMRQIARQFCRRKFDPAERALVDDLFAGTLQERYPLPPSEGEEPEYILLGALPDEALSYNVARMRRASEALQKHSDALEAFGIARKSAADDAARDAAE